MYQCCFTRAKLGFQTQATNSSNFSLSNLWNIISFLKLGSQWFFHIHSFECFQHDHNSTFLCSFFDWTLCDATSIFFTYSKTFSRQPDSHWKNPHHQKLLGEDAIVLYHVEKKRTLEKALRELCPQNHFLTYFVCKREDEKSQFFDNICRIHSKVIL